MQIAEIELYELLKSKLGDKEAKVLVEYIETKVDKEFTNKVDLLATKIDLEKLNGSLRTEIEKVKSEVIKWMFIFWVGQLASLIAIIEFILKK
jgi:hypothetical protein